MKVAFATQNGTQVDAHFGWTPALAIYDITPHGHALVETVRFADEVQEDGNEDKLAPRVEAIKDCAIVYVAAIGGSAAARVVANKVHPVKVNQPEAIEEIIGKLKAVIGGTPPPWLRKAMQKGQERSFDFDGEEVQHA
jgi:nitrogen fixation protein NifX